MSRLKSTLPPFSWADSGQQADRRIRDGQVDRRIMGSGPARAREESNGGSGLRRLSDCLTPGSAVKGVLLCPKKRLRPVAQGERLDAFARCEKDAKADSPGRGPH